jgi:hypothetical protein
MNQPTPPPTIELLQQQVAVLQQALAEALQALEESRRENTLLRQKLDSLARRFFGKQSEQLNDAQLELLLKLWRSTKLTHPVSCGVVFSFQGVGLCLLGAWAEGVADRPVTVRL